MKTCHVCVVTLAIFISHQHGRGRHATLTLCVNVFIGIIGAFAPRPNLCLLLPNLAAKTRLVFARRPPLPASHRCAQKVGIVVLSYDGGGVRL